MPSLPRSFLTEAVVSPTRAPRASLGELVDRTLHKVIRRMLPLSSGRTASPDDLLTQRQSEAADGKGSRG
jgi:hypothetical protein